MRDRRTNSEENDEFAAVLPDDEGGISGVGRATREPLVRSDRDIDGPSLSFPIQLMFGIISATIALPMTAQMFLINTQVAMPLDIIPTYGAFIFLPYSLQPLYAYLTTKTMGGRHWIIAGLLLCSALATYATTYIPKGGILLCMFLGFLRGITSSWPEFLLGLCLLDDAKAKSKNNKTTTAAEFNRSNQQHPHPHDNNDDSNKNSNDKNNMNKDRYDETLSRFQSQGATSRNIGAFLAHVVATTYLALVAEQQQQKSHKNNEDSAPVPMTRYSANALFVMSALLSIVGSIVAWKLQVGTGSTVVVAPQVGVASSTVISTNDDDDDDRESNENEPLATSALAVAVELSTVLRSPYDSVAGLGKEGERKTSTRTTAAATTTTKRGLDRSHNRSDNGFRQDSNEETSDSPFHSLPPPPSLNARTTRQRKSTPKTIKKNSGNSTDILILLLQVCLILFVLKDPIINATSAPFWNGLIAASFFALTAAAFRAFQANSFRWQNSHVVGLFLILRHAIPSSSMLMDSYIYTLFESRPSILQLLTLVSMGVMTFASWSYSRFLSSYTSGKQLYYIMAGTTAMGSLFCLSKLMLVVDIMPRTPSFLVKQALLTCLVQFLGTIAMEWMFLPGLVLATITAKNLEEFETENQNDSTTDVTDDDEEEMVMEPFHDERANCSDRGGIHSIDIDDNDTELMDDDVHDDTVNDPSDDDDEEESHHHRTGIQYGALLSCINFGNNLGALLATPLVNLLNIRREDGWAHLDRFIEVESVLTLLSICFIGMLLKR